MQRKLIVIFSADVVGYSALMERDETSTATVAMRWVMAATHLPCSAKANAPRHG